MLVICVHVLFASVCVVVVAAAANASDGRPASECRVRLRIVRRRCFGRGGRLVQLAAALQQRVVRVVQRFHAHLFVYIMQYSVMLYTEHFQT